MTEHPKPPDIVERLRIVGRQKREDLHRRVTVISGDGDLYDEAADEITRLRSPAPAEDGGVWRDLVERAHSLAACVFKGTTKADAERNRHNAAVLANAIDRAKQSERNRAALKAAPAEDGEGLREALEMSNRMAEDHGLWFVAETCAEAYLQQELRKLCDVIERAALSSGRDGGKT